MNRFRRCWALLAVCVLGCTAFAEATSGANPYQLQVGQATAAFGDTVTVGIELSNSGGGSIEELWVGVCTDWMGLEPLSMFYTSGLAQLNGGQGPEFFTSNVDPVGGSGVTCGAIFSFSGSASLDSGFAGSVLEMSYEVQGVPVGGVFHLTPCNSLGVTTGVTVGGTLLPVQATPGMVTYSSAPLVAFVRGDSDGDGAVDLADAIQLLGWITGGGEPGCWTAADVNGDMRIDISDPIALLGYLFASELPPVAPFPGCGTDPNSVFTCMTYSACP